MEARARKTEGFLFYEFEFKSDKVVERYALVVAKSKLWSVSATASPKRYAKKADFYRNTVASFVPKL